MEFGSAAAEKFDDKNKRVADKSVADKSVADKEQYIEFKQVCELLKRYSYDLVV